MKWTANVCEIFSSIYGWGSTFRLVLHDRKRKENAWALSSSGRQSSLTDKQRNFWKIWWTAPPVVPALCRWPMVSEGYPEVFRTDDWTRLNGFSKVNQNSSSWDHEDDHRSITWSFSNPIWKYAENALSPQSGRRKRIYILSSTMDKEISALDLIPQTCRIFMERRKEWAPFLKQVDSGQVWKDTIMNKSSLKEFFAHFLPWGILSGPGTEIIIGGCPRKELKPSVQNCRSDGFMSLKISITKVVKSMWSFGSKLHSFHPVFRVRAEYEYSLFEGRGWQWSTSSGGQCKRSIGQFNFIARFPERTEGLINPEGRFGSSMKFSTEESLFILMRKTN